MLLKTFIFVGLFFLSSSLAAAMISKFCERFKVSAKDSNKLKIFKKSTPWLVLALLICALLRQSGDLVEQAKKSEAIFETTQQSLNIDLYFSNIDCKDVKLVNVIDRKNRSVHKFDRHVFPEFNFQVANKYFLVGNYEQAETYYLKSLEEFNNLTQEQLADFYTTNYEPEKLKDVEVLIPGDSEMDGDKKAEVINAPDVYKYYIYTNLYVNSLSLHPDDQEKQDKYYQDAVRYHDVHFKGCREDKLGINQPSSKN